MRQNMTPKQQRFAEEYVLDHNGAGAAVRAGYARRSAKEIAAELLTKPHVRAAVAAKEALIARELGMTRQRVILELLEAVDLAREQTNPAGMIAGWREIARICGLYAPQRLAVGIETAERENEFSRMSDAELMTIVADTGTD